MPMRRLPPPARLIALVVLGCLALPVRAWVYPEHRDISVLAVAALDPQRRAAFDRLWAEARKGHEERLCGAGADAEQGLSPPCIDWAAFAAIAGDHSCSSANLVDTVLTSDWILAVAEVAAQLKVDLARVDVTAPGSQLPAGQGPRLDFRRLMEAETARAERLNALRTADTRLQRADPAYATRAGANNAHFLLPRPSTGTQPMDYAELALRVGSEISAVGVYAWYHLSALQKATRLATETLTPQERTALARAMLADEAFALHFLQDVFAAGHVAGTWGDASQRKGTHDFYNAAGLEVFLWGAGSDSVVLMGDAHMRRADAERAAAAVRSSLEQLLDHATGQPRKPTQPHTPAAPMAPDAFDVCRNDTLVRRPEGTRPNADSLALFVETARLTPIPSLGPGLGAMPRFRAEVGPFVGLAGMADLRWLDRGFVDAHPDGGWMGGFDLSLRAGLGLDGVIGESGDGLVFAALGVRGDSPSSGRIPAALQQAGIGSSAAAIPSRIGPSVRLRMPFYLIPGDLLLASPLLLFSPKTYAAMAVTASNGGLIPWQVGWATPVGRFQFVLGRELGVTWYGRAFSQTLVVPGTAPGSAQLMDLRSTMFDLPVVEYRPYRAFDTRQSSSVILQLFAGADVPTSGTIVSPGGGTPPDLRTVYMVGVRAVFDWRYYF